MSALLCPLLLQARASIPFATGIDPAQAAQPIEGHPWVEYPDPTQAPGVSCVGSRCAWWDSEPDETVHEEGSRFTRPTGRGRCGRARGRNFADPAGGAA